MERLKETWLTEHDAASWKALETWFLPRTYGDSGFAFDVFEECLGDMAEFLECWCCFAEDLELAFMVVGPWKVFEAVLEPEDFLAVDLCFPHEPGAVFGLRIAAWEGVEEEDFEVHIRN